MALASNGKTPSPVSPTARRAPEDSASNVVLAYKQPSGAMYRGSAEAALKSKALKSYRGKVQMLFTSPPFPLNTKKRYGNKKGEEYVEWLANLAPVFEDYLTPDGSIVIEIGNGWEAGQPVMSTLTLRALLAFLDKGKLQLCQQFIVYNPARLPSPAEWVNVQRIRVKDAFTHVWWMAPTARPKADNRRVLTKYSKSMRELLASQKYNSGIRPSQHNIGKKSFLTDNTGAIPSNVITLTNTSSSDEYLNHCRLHGLGLHPARMPAGLPAFFIKFLTDPGDLILDPFAGSNTTGAVAHALGRRWLRFARTFCESIGSRQTSVMNELEFYRLLSEADSVAAVESAIQEFEQDANSVRWIPVGGRENNRGTIDSAADPGRSVVERLTNGIDAILEYQHDTHGGRPDCRTPKEAATSWLNVPSGGLSDMTPTQRRALAQNVSVKVMAGEGKASRIIEVRDRGVGLSPEEMPRTILSLNESNKMQKHYLAGAYGQGGSSTFANSKYTLIASRKETTVGFTVVKFEDLPPEEYKMGRYVYLTAEGRFLAIDLPGDDFPRGTLIKHFGYDLTNYSASIGPNSLYGLLNQTLFDPVLPVWLDDHAVHSYRRVIKGSRNALNGATDEGDALAQGPTLSHRVRLFYASIADFGRIGIEYWVLERPTTTNKKPSAVFVNPNKPIILTLNGQDQAEMSQLLIKKTAELPYLALRLICHIDCNNLSPTAKRALFVSTRENARRGLVQELIQQEVVSVLRTDDELTRLNREARDQGLRERDETAEHEMRREVARLLQLQGAPVELGTVQARTSGAGEVAIPHPPRPRPPRPPAPPIALQEPPTFIRFVAHDEEEINFHPQQRRYIRIETDANSNYHHPTDPVLSRINIISTTNGVTVRGSTALEGGRMRAIFEGAAGATIGNTGTIRVELSRPGLPMLSDSRACRIITPPPTRQESQQITLPPFVPIPLSPEHDQWTALNWPEDTNAVASEAQMDHGTLNIYYSTVFPKYAGQRSVFERRSLTLAESFTKRYEIWIAVHSLLLHREEENSRTDEFGEEQAEQLLQGTERNERCRVGTLSAMFAAREVEMSASAVADTD